MTTKIAILRVIKGNIIERIFLVDAYLDTRTQFQNVHLRSNAKVFEIIEDGSQKEVTILDLEKETKLDTESLLKVFKYREIEEAMHLPLFSLVSNDDYAPVYNVIVDENRVDITIEDTSKEIDEENLFVYGKKVL